jgi:hypothetical protein
MLLVCSLFGKTFLRLADEVSREVDKDWVLEDEGHGKEMGSGGSCRTHVSCLPRLCFWWIATACLMFLYVRLFA